MKKTMQFTGLLIAGSSILLSACGQQEEKATAYDKIQKDGTIVVATAGTLFPTSYHEEKNNKLTGFDVENHINIRMVRQSSVKVIYQASSLLKT